ncbi:MAG: hypothetical protein GF331_16465 [Chitinivibrionales bacterium]|nr:hypothetical protein [Chitinivibrionales bacterium]
MADENRRDDKIIDIKQARHRAARAKPDQSMRELLEADDAAALEGMVMEKLEEPQLDSGFFLQLFAGLVKRGDTDTAEVYLQLLLDLLEQRDTELAIELLSALLVQWPECAAAREHLIGLVRDHYAASPSFGVLSEHYQIERASDPLDALGKVESWLPYDQGRAVYSPNFGVGRVEDINLSLGKIRVAFQDQAGKLESFRIDTARKLLEPLVDGHFLVEKLNKPDELRVLAKDNPGELLRRLFASERRTMTVSELKQMLNGVVPASSWTSWWGRARQDSRLTVGTGTRPTVSWADSAEQAEEAIGRQFTAAAPEEKIELALKHVGRSDGLSATLVGELGDMAGRLKDREPSLALEMALAVDKLGGPSEPLKALVTRSDIDTLVRSVRDRALRRRAQTMLRECRDDWQPLYLALLKTESDSQSIAQMYGALREVGSDEQLQRLVATVLAEPALAPHLYLWLCKEMGSRDELAARADWPFLQTLLTALGNQELKGQQAALRRLFDPGSVADIAVKRLTDQEAKDLLAALDKGPALEDYRRDSLRGYVLECHPELRQNKKEVIFTTAEALSAKQDEFQRLIKEDIPANTEAMKKAKEHGDLRENFEYHAARARQEMLSSRAKTLHDQLACAQILDPATVDASSVAVGTKVRLQPLDEGQDGLVLTILGPWDSDPNNHVVSYLAPAVASLIGTRKGQEVTYDGARYTVASIASWR